MSTTNKAKFSFFLQNWPEHKTQQQQIEDGKSEADIRELGNRSRKFKKMRAKYLIY
jgi:hypothetical protein